MVEPEFNLLDNANQTKPRRISCFKNWYSKTQSNRFNHDYKFKGYQKEFSTIIISLDINLAGSVNQGLDG